MRRTRHRSLVCEMKYPISCLTIRTFGVSVPFLYSAEHIFSSIWKFWGGNDRSPLWSRPVHVGTMSIKGLPSGWSRPSIASSVGATSASAASHSHPLACPQRSYTSSSHDGQYKVSGMNRMRCFSIRVLVGSDEQDVTRFFACFVEQDCRAARGKSHGECRRRSSHSPYRVYGQDIAHRFGLGSKCPHNWEGRAVIIG